jgi:hypothetical protein
MAVRFFSEGVIMGWAAEEFAGADLGDKRLNKRLVVLVERFADKPTASIPGASGGWGETQATGCNQKWWLPCWANE